MTRATRMLWALGVCLLIAGGCAKAPTEQITVAEKAIEEARAAGAADYLPEDFTKLDGMLAAAKQEIADQDTKFALLRDYQKAEQGLLQVQADAERVRMESQQKKEEVKAEAERVRAEAQDAVKTAQALLAKAPVGKDRVALEAIKADVQGLEKSLGDVDAALGSQDYKGAAAKAQAIQQKAVTVASELQTAIDKVATAKGKRAKRSKA